MTVEKGDRFYEIDKNSRPVEFYKSLSQHLNPDNPPKAILIVSAHWEESEFTVGYQTNGTSLIYDYYGFPSYTYAPHLTYETITDLSIADTVVKSLEDAGISCLKKDRGFDHGVFIPLKLAFPQPTIPIIQLSLKRNLDIKSHVNVGKALSKLRDEGILIVGSGSLTHNLNQLFTADSAPAPWAVSFLNWVKNTLEKLSSSNYNEVEENLISIMSKAPNAIKCHPRIEHLVPLFVAFGAAVGNRNSDSCLENDVSCRQIYSQIAVGSLALDSYLFE